jgi:hypothetical protein
VKATQNLTVDPPDSPTFEKVWMLFQETREQMKETDRKMQETDRKFQETKEQIAATDRQMKETAQQVWKQMQETDRKMKETDKRVGELTNRFGNIVEHMVVPNLLDKFKALDFTFEAASRDYKIDDRKNGIFVEVDAFLQNGDKVMIVEIKTTPTTQDIKDHVKRLEKLRQYADLRQDRRKYLGAVAGVVMSESVKNQALGSGFFVVIPSGDTFNIIKPEGKYRVKEW